VEGGRQAGGKEGKVVLSFQQASSPDGKVAFFAYAPTYPRRRAMEIKYRVIMPMSTSRRLLDGAAEGENKIGLPTEGSIYGYWLTRLSIRRRNCTCVRACVRACYRIDKSRTVLAGVCVLFLLLIESARLAAHSVLPVRSHIITSSHTYNLRTIAVLCCVVCTSDWFGGT
jgi:hypothetical protein